LSKLYSDFKSFCKDDNYIPVTKRILVIESGTWEFLLNGKIMVWAVNVERIIFSTSDNNTVS